MSVVLASGSPRRRVLLAFLVGGARVQAPDVDESLPALDPMEALQEVARRKALAVAPRTDPTVASPGPSAPASEDPSLDRLGRRVVVLAADTAVVRGERIIGKPADAEQARTMLRRLSAGRHDVVTGVAVWTPGGATGEATAADTGHGEGDSGQAAGRDIAAREVVTCAVSTRLRFDPIPDAVLDAYIASAAWKGKAGGYGIQDPDLAPFIHIEEGPWSNVVGLPLAATAGLLRGAGVACQDPPSETWLVRHNPF